MTVYVDDMKAKFGRMMQQMRSADPKIVAFGIRRWNMAAGLMAAHDDG